MRVGGGAAVVAPAASSDVYHYSLLVCRADDVT